MNSDLKIGELVESLSGRDKSTIYMVSDITNNGYVVLVNGKNRTFTNPKIKNKKHLKSLNFTITHLQEKLKLNKNIYDAEVFSSIKKYKES